MSRMLLLGLLALGCSSNQYEGGGLGLKWKPPDGVKLLKEVVDGQVTAASFSNGVELRRVDSDALPTSGNLGELKNQILAASRASAPGEVQSARAGSIPAGPVARWETLQGDDRTLLYYLPANDHYLVLTLTTSPNAFDRKANKLELSLSTLHLSQ